MAPSPAKIGKILKGGVVTGALATGLYEIGTVLKDIIYENNIPPVNRFSTTNIFIYPHDIPRSYDQNYCIIFQFYQYDRPSILHKPTLKPLGAICLPLPTDMLDSINVNYNQDRNGPLAGAALENASNMKDAAAKLASGDTSKLLNDLSVGAKTIVAQLITGNVGAQNTNKVLQMAGLAINPFLTVLFDSPNFKRFSFNWTFIPQNKEDSLTLRNILDKFRYHALPGIMPSQGGLLLNYPDMVIPKILPNEYMFDMKQCVVEGVDINYAPGATPAFFAGTNAPNAIRLTVRLLEIEYWVKSDLLSPSYHSGTSSGTSGFITDGVALPEQGGPSN